MRENVSLRRGEFMWPPDDFLNPAPVFASAGHHFDGSPVELPQVQSPKTRLRVFWPFDLPRYRTPDEVTCVVVMFPDLTTKEV